MYIYTIYEEKDNQKVKLDFICSDQGNQTLSDLEKTAKKRTKASAKKTIEELNTDDNKSIENHQNSRESKMGEKGWWDR